MNPRTTTSPAPGKGLCNFGIMPVGNGTTLVLYLAANVEVKDFTMPQPINRIDYRVIPRPSAPPLVPDEVVSPKRPNPLAHNASVIDVPDGPQVEISGCSNPELNGMHTVVEGVLTNNETGEKIMTLPTAQAICYPKEFAPNLRDQSGE